jgi:dCTP deaminase
MAVLTKPEILKLIKQKKVVIEPFDKQSIGPASIDFHLSNSFRIFKWSNKNFIVDKKVDYHKVTELITVQDSMTLLPGKSVHGITVESLTLPNNICGWIQGRSTLARIGLMVHVTANFIHPGMHGHQVLEMTNAGPMALTIKIGIPICQIILEETKGEAEYRGKFHQQELP